jgi:hypothetical protein
MYTIFNAKLAPLAAAAVAAAIMLPSAGSATPVFSCGATPSSNCNGNTYALVVDSHVGNTYQVEYDIKVGSSYIGSSTDVVSAIEIASLVSSYTNLSLISAPDGTSKWTLSDLELNANGCDSGGSAHNICADATAPYAGATVGSAGNILSWVFQFDSTDTLSSTGHIKYLYEDSTGKKVGDLGSWDLATQPGSPPPPPPPPVGVPEPSTLALLGGLLVALFGLRRLKPLSRSA